MSDFYFRIGLLNERTFILFIFFLGGGGGGQFGLNRTSPSVIYLRPNLYGLG